MTYDDCRVRCIGVFDWRIRVNHVKLDYYESQILYQASAARDDRLFVADDGVHQQLYPYYGPRSIRHNTAFRILMVGASPCSRSIHCSTTRVYPIHRDIDVFSSPDGAPLFRTWPFLAAAITLEECSASHLLNQLFFQTARAP